MTLNNGTKKVISFKGDEIIGLAHFPLYPLPAILNPQSAYKSGVSMTGMDTIAVGGEELLKALGAKYGFTAVSWNHSYKGIHFETMVARIAYCAVIYLSGHDALKTTFVLPAILEQVDDVGRWFGCDDGNVVVPPIGIVNSANAMNLHLVQSNEDGSYYLVVAIKFFAGSPSPEYIVVVGEPTDVALTNIAAVGT
ncbi:MAG: hypothetical protein HYX43_03130 [Burkholderiales bacterium]|nr:hypothetical protein [Burkholderiales bacterium]